MQVMGPPSSSFLWQLWMIALLVVCLSEVSAFAPASRAGYGQFRRHKATWQEDLDQLLDVDSTLSTRTLKARDLIGKFTQISADVISAVKDRNVEKIAPSNLDYGKAVKGLYAFNRQVVSDVIPELLTRTVPKLMDESPKLISAIGSVVKKPSIVVEEGKRAANVVKEIASNPTMRHSAFDAIRRELKNVVRITPEGMQVPYYEVLGGDQGIELRRYDGYTVCSTDLSSESSNGFVTDVVSTLIGYQRLLYYFLASKIATTAPILLDSKGMSFIMPSEFTASTAPAAQSASVELRDVPGADMAVLEFAGMVTEGEALRQKAKLEDALVSQNIRYDPSSFQIFQYNPLYALPWVRRNEIAVRVILDGAEAKRDEAFSI